MIFLPLLGLCLLQPATAQTCNQGLVFDNVLNKCVNTTVDVPLIPGIESVNETVYVHAEDLLLSDITPDSTSPQLSLRGLAQQLQAKISSAVANEAALQTYLASETSRASAQERSMLARISTAVSAQQDELLRAQAAEALALSQLSTETSRAIAAEAVLQSMLAAEVSRATSSEQAVALQAAASVATEASRAKASEDAFSSFASSRYLSQTTASATYLTKALGITAATADATYLKQSTASITYDVLPTGGFIS